MKLHKDQKWLPEHEAILIERRNSRVSYADIARELGRGRSSILHRAHKLIAEGRIEKLQPWRHWKGAEIGQLRRLIEMDKLTVCEAAKRLGRTRDAVIKVAAMNNICVHKAHWLPSEIAEALRLRAIGKPGRVIAATLGRPYRGVIDKIRKELLKLKRNQHVDA